jgi:hypothetical protein
MAEAFLSHYAANQFEVYSGGYKPLPIHPFAVKVMQEIGYDLSNQQSKDMLALIKGQHFGVAVSVCRKTEPDCPLFLAPQQELTGILKTQQFLLVQIKKNLIIPNYQRPNTSACPKILEERSMVVRVFDFCCLQNITWLFVYVQKAFSNASLVNVLTNSPVRASATLNMR